MQLTPSLQQKPQTNENSKESVQQTLFTQQSCEAVQTQLKFRPVESRDQKQF